MAIISLEPGETLTVMFNGVENHEFEIHHDSDEHEGKIVVVETGGVNGSEVGEADSILFSDELPEEEEGEEDEEESEEEGDDESDDEEDDEAGDEAGNNAESKPQ